MDHSQHKIKGILIATKKSIRIIIDLAPKIFFNIHRAKGVICKNWNVVYRFSFVKELNRRGAALLYIVNLPKLQNKKKHMDHFHLLFVTLNLWRIETFRGSIIIYIKQVP